MLAPFERTGALSTVEEGTRALGWGAEVSLDAEQAGQGLTSPPRRTTMPYAPLPAAAVVEDAARPPVERIVDVVSEPLREGWS